MQKKFIIGGVLLVAAAALVLAIESENWNCYEDGDGCRCVLSATGGENLCSESNLTLGEDPLYFTVGIDGPPHTFCEARAVCTYGNVICDSLTACYAAPGEVLCGTVRKTC